MMRPEQLARLQALAKLRESRDAAALARRLEASAGLEAARQRLSTRLSEATPAPGALDPAHFQAASRLDRLFAQGVHAYRTQRPRHDDDIVRARADYARALGQLRALAALRDRAEAAARRRQANREDEQRSAALAAGPAKTLPTKNTSF